MKHLLTLCLLLLASPLFAQAPERRLTDEQLRATVSNARGTFAHLLSATEATSARLAAIESLLGGSYVSALSASEPVTDADLLAGVQSISASIDALMRAADLTDRQLEAVRTELGARVSHLGDFVTFDSPAVAAIIGPQVKHGSDLVPYAWYDSIAITRGPELADRALHPLETDGRDHYSGYVMYYDLSLTLYTLYHRTGDEQILTLARQVTDKWIEWLDDHPAGTWAKAAAPRSINLLGVMLRAADGRPELWPQITKATRDHLAIWLLPRLDYSRLHYGVRDGGYALLFAARLAQVHPDPSVRLEMRGYALQAARDYYARLQRDDGGWYYKVATMDSLVSQPFQVGLLLEGLIATHQLTGDTAVARAIVKGTDWLWRYGFDNREPWKAMYYFVSESHGQTPFHPADRAGPTWEKRQLNATTIHAFGYAYILTGDRKYIEQGDALFEATFNYDPENPRQSTGLAFYRGKEYSQSYRSSGHYLAWRLR